MSRDILQRTPLLRQLVYRFSFGFGPLIPLQLARFLAYCIGICVWFIDRRGQRTVAENMRTMLPPGHPRASARIVQRSYHNFCLSIAESLHIHRFDTRLLEQPHLRIVDPWSVLGGRTIPGPAIICTVHMNWELGLAVLYHLGKLRESIAIALPHDDPSINEMFERARASIGCRTLDLDSAPLATLRALREDDAVLAMVVDRDYAGSGVPTRMLGREIRIPVGPAALAVQTGAPILPMFLARSGRTRFVAIVDRPIRPDPTRTKHAQVRELSQRLADSLTRFMRAAPPQWVAFHAVW